MEGVTEPRDPSQPDPPTTIEDDRSIQEVDELRDSEATSPHGPTGLDAIDEALAREDSEATSSHGPTGLDAIDEDLARQDRDKDEAT